jgi:hypothetical protein
MRVVSDARLNVKPAQVSSFCRLAYEVADFVQALARPLILNRATNSTVSRFSSASSALR